MRLLVLTLALFLPSCDDASPKGVDRFLKYSADGKIPASDVVAEARSLYPKTDGEARGRLIAGLFRLMQKRSDVRDSFKASPNPEDRRILSELEKRGKLFSEDGF